MQYQEKLKEIFHNRQNYDLSNFSENIANHLRIISDNCFAQKGVFTVVVTLCLYKIFYPEQDIRLHQANMDGGFSGRSFDTKYVTPTLKEIGLPSMAESGWLTRSLEQPYPYDKHYLGKISGKNVKTAFLEIVNYIQTIDNADNILGTLFNLVSSIQDNNIISIGGINLEQSDFTIDIIMKILTKHFNEKYNVAGGSKLPVIAFYSLLKCLMGEAIYKNCRLGVLGSHTASDLTSKTAGDIEIYNQINELMEAFEIKHNKIIDANIVRVAREKIYKYNPRRYYILSSATIKSEDIDIINSIIEQIRIEHGCHIIVNGLMATIKYYLRLIPNLNEFVENYCALVENDNELKQIHKQTLKNILENKNG
jgi:DNA (cytosine-5)-methyltransferase 1